MAGIYIHIPFCKTKCSYCDFYKSTNFQQKNRLIDAILQEIILRKDYLQETVNTIYFGGGTPSTLPIADIEQILQRIENNFELSKEVEISLEANPDDLTTEYLVDLSKTKVNRLSIGIQSFDDEQLKFINRRHTAKEALDAVEMAKTLGFNNISIDLIYGLPFQTIESWQEQIQKATTIGVQHISSYGLTYEEGTALWRQMKNKQVTPASDEMMIEMYRILIETCKKAGFEQYEISNFAKNNLISKHNSSYWNHVPYLGLGPSAHSYDISSRQWNVSDNTLYCSNIEQGLGFFETEVLNENEKLNDFILTSLRTIKGIDLVELNLRFGENNYNELVNAAQIFITKEQLIIKERYLRLTDKGILLSDNIIMNLMKV